MADFDYSKATTTKLNTAGLDYEVEAKNLDEGETKSEGWTNPLWPIYLGYYKTIPEFKEPMRALARWTVGKGFTTDNRTKVILDNITGWGEDSFQSILTNLIIVKKINGDAFAEIIRNDKGTLINLKPLNPRRVKIFTDTKGIITHYQTQNVDGKWSDISKDKIFHICNDRIANEVHGTSAVEACQWELDAKRECMKDWRRISHRSTIRVLIVPADNADKIKDLRLQWQQAIKDGEVMILPAKPGETDVKDITLPPIDAFIRWIEYLDRRIYQSLGVPKAIADTADFTEAASKVGYLTFEPVYTEEQTLLEQDLWNQLAIKIKFNRPPSLHGIVAEDEQKNVGQTGFQATEMQATAGRVE